MGYSFDYKVLFVFMIPLWIIIRAITLLIKAHKSKNISVKRETTLFAFFFYILCVLAVTMFPLMITWEADSSMMISVNIIPVYTTMNDMIHSINGPIRDFMVDFWIKNIGGNLVLLLPLGIFLPMLWKRFLSYKNTIFAAFLISAGIETSQLISCYFGNWGRTFDIDDMILNTLGAFLGLFIYKKVMIKILIKMKFMNKEAVISQ